MPTEPTPSEVLDEVEQRIHELEGEIMLAGFYGTSIDFYKDRLLAAYEERNRLRAAREKK